MGGYRLAVDIGGTFTDVVLQSPSGYVSGKVLTTPAAPEEGVIQGILQVLENAKVRPEEIDLAIHGTTLATNAIIERHGAKTALITTEGFRDTLEFAFGHRSDQYDLDLVRAAPLVGRPWRLEVPERIAADGSVLLALDEKAVHAIAKNLKAEKVESAGICFMHSYCNSDHERRVREILLEEVPGLYVSVSYEVCPEIREFERTSTTIANAYIQPLIATYLGNLVKRLEEIGYTNPLLMIMSSGSLASVETAMRLPIRLVESGPAGGAILGQHISKQIGAVRSIALDMGGTTAKIVLLNEYEARHSRMMEVARAYRFLPGSGLPLRIPVIDMIEIGAGGGSIAQVDELGRIAVGPESSGAVPGPACYGNGGERPTVTDSDLVLGKLDGKFFAGGTMALHEDMARTALERHVAQPAAIDMAAAAAGTIEIVDEKMANATRVHAADAGEDVESRVLIATGGAGPLHAARIAEKLEIETVVIPQGAGVGSAHGFLKAPVAYEAVYSHLVALDAFDPEAINAIFARLREEAVAIIQRAAGKAALNERRFADIRYRGQGHELNIELPARAYGKDDAAVIGTLYDAQYEKNYGRRIPGLKAEVLTWTLLLTAAIEVPDDVAPQSGGAAGPAPVDSMRSVFDTDLGKFVDASVIRRTQAGAGSTFSGPALIIEDQTTIWVPSSFDGSVSAHGHVILTKRTTQAGIA
jgi:N-methylhydantoinase A